MAQNIALNIILNGVPQAVSNIEELEIKLKQAKLELSQIAIGSDAFKKLSKEIADAESKLKNLQKSAEGKDLEGKLGDLARLGGAIGASFGAATAAFALFGEESEDTTKALVQAQNALVIALAAREAAEGAVVVKTIANDLATKALTLSTEATNKVTKAFYATLAANPYAAIVTAIGLVVGAFVLLTGETDEATKAQKEFNDALKKDITTELTKFNELKRTIENTNLSLETRREALKKLETQFPKYFEGLDKEKILTGDLKIKYDSLADAIRKSALARAFEGQIASRALEIYELTEREAELQERIAQAKKDQAEASKQIVTGGPGFGGAVGGQTLFQEGVENRVFKLLNEQEKVQKRLNYLKALDKKAEQDIEKLKTDIDDRVGATEEKETKITKEKKEQVITNTKLISQQNALNDKLDELRAILSFESVSEPTIIKEQEKILSNFEEIFNKVKSIAPDINSEINKIFQVQTKDFPDPFKSIVNNTTKFLELLTTVPVKFEDIKSVFEKLDLKGSLELFTDEQKQDLTSYFNTIKKGADGLQEALKAAGQELSNTEVANIFNQALLEREETLKRIKSGEINSAQAQLELQKSLIKIFAEKLKVNEKILEGEIKSGEDLTAKFNAQLKLNESAKQFADVITNGIVALSEFGNEVNEQGQVIIENNKKIEEQFKLLKTAIDSLNVQQVSELFTSLGFDVVTTFKYISDNFEKLGPELVKKITESTKFMLTDLDSMSKEQLLKLKKGLADAQKEFETKAPEIAETINDTIGKIDFKLFIMNAQEAIAQFQSVLNSLSQTTSLYFSAQFDQLEKRYTRLQESIVGDSEAANQKRLEAEKAYQQQKMELEKKAAKTALRISLAQALANTAEAITKLAAITGGIGAVIGAGAIVAFNAAQVAIIGNQLATIDSYKRGGRIKSMAGGGFITGPSHEYGGVKFQGGGVELEGNESVINRVSTINYMGLLNQINQAGGGRPIGPGFDDSRIVEAIAKQRNTPIRAYVVESDITAKQETARRLEKLSQI